MAICGSPPLNSKIHILRNRKIPLEAEEWYRDRIKRFKEKVCLASDIGICEGPIISAHTLSVGAMLRPISRNGHVYTLSADRYAESYDDVIQLKLTGIRATSVFNGFCAKHDKILFSEIEDKPFVCSAEQNFLHCYRAVAKESYLKMRQADIVPSTKEYHQMHRGQNISGHDEFKAGAFKSAYDLEYFKSKLDRIYESRDFGRIITRVVEFEEQPKIICNSNYLPDFDYEGNVIQDLGDYSATLQNVSLTIIPSKNGGFALFSYLDTASKAGDAIFTSLIRQPNITTSIIWMIFCQFENMAISPFWLDSLENETISMLIKASRDAANPILDDLNRLARCPSYIDDWGVKRIFSL